MPSRVLCRAFLQGLLAAAFMCVVLPAPAQKVGPALPQTLPDPAPVVAEPDAILPANAPRSPLNPLGDPGLESRLQRIRAEEQRRRIVVDAERLVRLTTQYREAVVKHGTPTAEDQGLLAQAEKLARDIESRTSGR